MTHHETAAVRDVLAERRRQIETEGWTPEHDDTHREGELATAAACYIRPALRSATTDDPWPWDEAWWKPRSRRRDLVRAAALIIAEVERLDRLPAPSDTADHMWDEIARARGEPDPVSAAPGDNANLASLAERVLRLEMIAFPEMRVARAAPDLVKVREAPDFVTDVEFYLGGRRYPPGAYTLTRIRDVEEADAQF